MTSTIRCKATTLNSICQLNLNTLKARPDSVEGPSTNYKTFVHKCSIQQSTLSRHTEQHHLLFSLPARDACRGVYCHALKAAIFGQWIANKRRRVASVAKTRAKREGSTNSGRRQETMFHHQPMKESSAQPMSDHTRSLNDAAMASTRHVAFADGFIDQCRNVQQQCSTSLNPTRSLLQTGLSTNATMPTLDQCTPTLVVLLGLTWSRKSCPVLWLWAVRWSLERS